MSTDTMLREYDPTVDEAVVYSTFLNSYIRNALKDENLPSMIKNVDRKVFFTYYKAELDRVLEDPDTEILVVCWDKEPTEIFGYSIKQNNNLIYIYIKRAYYNKGIEDLLLTKQFDSEPYIKYASASCVRAVKNVFLGPLGN